MEDFVPLNHSGALPLDLTGDFRPPGPYTGPPQLAQPAYAPGHSH